MRKEMKNKKGIMLTEIMLIILIIALAIIIIIKHFGLLEKPGYGLNEITQPVITYTGRL